MRGKQQEGVEQQACLLFDFLLEGAHVFSLRAVALAVVESERTGSVPLLLISIPAVPLLQHLLHWLLSVPAPLH